MSEDFTNYEIASLLVSAHIAALTSKDIVTLLPTVNDFSNRKYIDRLLRSVLVPKYSRDPKYNRWFLQLTRRDVARLLKIPVKELTADTYSYIISNT